MPLETKDDSLTTVIARATSAAQCGLFIEARDLFVAAAQRAPEEPVLWLNLALVQMALGNVDGAVASCEHSLRLKSDMAAAHQTLGEALRTLGRYKEAAAAADEALTYAPFFPEALISRANSLLSLQHFEAALAAYDRAIVFGVRNVQIYNNRGMTLLKLGRPADALASCNVALELTPTHIGAWLNKGSALRVLQLPEEALACFDFVLNLDPVNPQAWSSRGTILTDLGRHDEAVTALERAVTIMPDFAEAHHNLGFVLDELGQTAKAQQAHEAAVRLCPDRPSFYVGVTGARHLDILKTLQAKSAGLEPNEHVQLHFNIAELYVAGGEPARALPHYVEGNKLRRIQVSYDEKAALHEMQQVKSVIDRAFLHERSSWSQSRFSPIFIVGMPRSGSTLLEQILASHPRVSARGETKAFFESLASTHLGRDFTFPGSLPILDKDDMRRIAGTYQGKVSSGRADGIIVDKMLENFRFLGLIHLLLPCARFIHIRRNPLDTCLSCFTKNFTFGTSYAYDLAELARYHRACEELMQYWHETVAEDVILDVCYEDLVRNFEPEVRRLLTFCDLSWDPHCMEFHRFERSVRTASSSQVRQPLFQASVTRHWRRSAVAHTLRQHLGLVEDNGPRSFQMIKRTR